VFRRHGEIREQLSNIIEKFRQKGALSPEKAMTAEELGFPVEFKERMKRRLGQLGIFVEVNGKYYLSEERLKQVKGKIAERRRNRSW
jgi:lipoate-protein ligase A